MAKRNCFFPVILELPVLLYRNKYHENALVGFKCQTSKRFESRTFVWLLNQTPLLPQSQLVLCFAGKGSVGLDFLERVRSTLLLPGFSFEVTLGELHHHP
jgi:hypothetical protein